MLLTPSQIFYGDPAVAGHQPSKAEIVEYLQAQESRITTQRAKVTSLWLYVSGYYGDDSNTGLGDGPSGNALKTPARAVELLYQQYDMAGSPATIFIENWNQPYPGGINAQGHPVGYHFFYLEGQTEGGVTIESADSTASVCTIGDYGCVIFRKIKFVGKPGSFGHYGIACHQHAIFDVFEGCEFGEFPSGVHMGNDGGGAACFNLPANYKISGSAIFHVEMRDGAKLTNQSGGVVTITNSPSFTTFINMIGAGNTLSTGAIVYSGTATMTSGRSLYVDVNSAAFTTGTVYPGGNVRFAALRLDGTLGGHIGS